MPPDEPLARVEASGFRVPAVFFRAHAFGRVLFAENMKRVIQGESLIGDPTAGCRFYMLQQGGSYTGVPAAGIGEDIGDMDGGAGFSGQDEDIEVGASGQAAFRSPGRKPDFLERAVFPLQAGVPVQCHAGAKAVEAFGFLFQGENPAVQVIDLVKLFRIRVLHVLYLYGLDQIHGTCFSRLF